MDTAKPSEQLQELNRLTSATRAEATRAPWWALPVIGVGAALFLSLSLLHSQLAWTIGSVVWVVFVAGWAMVLRRKVRAVARWVPSFRAETPAGIAGAVSALLGFFLGLAAAVR